MAGAQEDLCKVAKYYFDVLLNIIEASLGLLVILCVSSVSLAMNWLNICSFIVVKLY
jgi:hypothetical protein